jgi:hypothetical protein
MLDAILGRHWDAGLPSPLAGNMTYSQLFNCVGCLIGKQQKHKFPITRQMVCDALRLRPTTPGQFRNKMILVVGTMGIMRPGEIAAAQTCDFKFDDDFKKGLISTRGSSTLYTGKRKQDQERKGHQMRFSKSADPELDVNNQMGLYMDELDIRLLTTCSKPTRPHARCKCPPLFPRRHRLAQGPSHGRHRIQGHHFQHIQVGQRCPGGHWRERHRILRRLLPYGWADSSHRGWGA